MAHEKTLEERRSNIAALPPLRDVIRENELAPKKSLGQHFLTDLNITDKIARTARSEGATHDAPLAGHTVLEVGPGPGALTRSLLTAGANVVAVERAARAIAALAPLKTSAGDALTIVEADATRTDFSAIVPPGALICANLPYNVATPIIIGWLSATPWPAWWASATFMVQREVADRMVAAPGTDAYGRLAVLTAARCLPTKVFDLPPDAFVPPPKVWSSVVRLDPKPDIPGLSPQTLGRVTAAAFGQRRKKLRSSLKSLTKTPDDLLAAAHIDADRRAETLTVDEFITLAALTPMGTALD